MYLQGELLSRGDNVDPRPDAAAEPSPRKEREAAPWRSEILGSSAAVRDLLEKAAKVAASQASVLVRGESGTGKELLARAIHRHSPRAEKPFVTVHCAALSSSLLESELFGHVKGAFTGRSRQRPAGSDSRRRHAVPRRIGDISLETQTSCSRVAAARSSRRRRANLNVDVRLIAATHQNLESSFAKTLPRAFTTA
jgi:two-component system response regulator GlrR